MMELAYYGNLAFLPFLIVFIIVIVIISKKKGVKAKTENKNNQNKEYGFDNDEVEGRYTKHNDTVYQEGNATVRVHNENEGHITYESNTTYGNQSKPAVKKYSIIVGLYFLVFAIIWESMVIPSIISLIRSTSDSSGYFPIILFLSMFVLVGVIIFVIGIITIIKAIINNNRDSESEFVRKNNKNNNQNNYNQNDFEDSHSDDQYFVKYCKYCGESLKKTDKVCPGCGAKVE